MVVRTYQEELSYLDKIANSTWRIKKGFVPNMKVIIERLLVPVHLILIKRDILITIFLAFP